MTIHSSTQPPPLLLVATDIVRSLEGCDALCHLWTLFSKSKGSLQDGGRLENISWRLWHRELASSSSSSHHTLSPYSVSSGLSDSGASLCDGSIATPNVYQSPAPSSVGSTMTSSPNIQRIVHPSSSSSSNDRKRSRADAPIGKIICDIVPGKPVLSRKHAATATATMTKPVISNTTKPPSGLSKTKPPEPPGPMPSLCVPSSPPPTSVFPSVSVVVLKPTPTPTPHPTPPATPIPSNMAPVPTHLPSPHLLPTLPPPIRGLGHKPQIVPPQQSSSSMPPPPLPPPPQKPADATLKPSDRRFFLKQSPEDGDGESPERNGKASSDVGSSGGSSSQMQASSSGTTSSHRRASVESTTRRAVAVAVGVPRSRKGKEVVRHGHASRRLGAARQNAAVAAQRKVVNVGEGRQRPSFNIGSVSVSSNGVKTRSSRQSEGVDGHPPSPAPPPPEMHAPGPSMRPNNSTRDVMSSSEYETTTTDDTDDDDLWASEDDVDTEERVRAETETQLREAAREAQRQREMFTKVPQRSYSGLNQRTRSGLLSTLLNPDPKIFPVNHPYRTSYSSLDVQGIGRSGGVNGSGSGPMRLQTSRSAAVLPLAAQMTAVTAHAPVVSGGGGGEEASSVYRPKGRPRGEEMEESDSGEEDTIQVSKSVAQQRLAALAGRRGSDRAPAPVVGGARRSSDQGPSIPPPQQPPAPPRRPALHSVATAPIPFGHPYNLPAPAPPMTPRATRRQMLSTELSESLRRNLLWERQVSKLNMMGGGRRQAGGRTGEGSGEGGKPSTSSNGEDVLAERKRAAMARNRSWADDYHYAGW